MLRVWRTQLGKYRKIEQPAGNIVGTVNDAYRPPAPNHYHGSHHWTYERLLAMGLVPLTAAPFLGVTHPIVDTTFCLSVLFHSHCGFKSCIIDYIPERVYGVWHRHASRLLTFGSFVSMYGIYVIETEANGIFPLIRSLW